MSRLDPAPQRNSIGGCDVRRRHRQYQAYVERESHRIRRSHFWAQLSQEFETSLAEGHFTALGVRARAYSPQLGRDAGARTRALLLEFMARGMRHLSRTVESWVPQRLRWQRAFLELGLDKGPAPYNPFTHPVLGAGTCKLSPDIFRMHYFFAMIYPFCKAIQTPKVLEVGAGAGMLGVLCHSDLGAKYVIVDLPEVIGFSSAVIATLLPKARFLFPHEIRPVGSLAKQVADVDFVFLWPDQTALIDDDSIDVAVNTSSFMEMRSEEIGEYFSLIQRSVKDGGIFYCCNRLEKRPGLGDTVVRHFLKYPWRPQNEDVHLGENLLITRAGGHLHIDRLQRVRK